ncbi:MAG: hypothetical protein Q7S34_01460 [bacterium]|nr:hypothetical protein [bacterium]
MGKLEQETNKRSRKKNLQKFILSTVKMAGVLSIGLVAPNVLKAMASAGILSFRRENELIKRSRERLIKGGLLVYKNKLLHLTPKGESTLRRFELREFKLKKPRHWDGKWRVLIFDIPEKRRRLRDRIRETLVMIGFVRLQDSVWAYPYDCEDAITLLKADFGIGKSILYMIVEMLEGDSFLKKHFDL